MVSLAAPGGAMPPPPKPPQTPLRRPILALKRDSSYLDTDDETDLSSSTKKLRVAFDPNVDVRILEDWTEKSFDLVKEEVAQAVDRHVAPVEERDDTQYVKLLQLFDKDPASGEALNSKLLQKYIYAINSKMSLLGECGKLVIAVLDVSWLGRHETLLRFYCKTLIDVASTHAKFIPAMMERLVPHFAKLPASLGRLPEESVVSRQTMFARVHLVLKALCRQVPSVSNALMRALRKEFPNDLATAKSYSQYQRHLLRLADNVPELRSEICALLVQRLVSIDVQIQRDIEDLEEEAEYKLLHRADSRAINGGAEDSDDSDIDSVSESEETITEEEERLRDLRLKVTKMDSTLDLLFEYYELQVDPQKAPEQDDAYQQLLSHFTTFILPNRTRHAQFLVFHYSQTSAAHTDTFAERCLQIAVHEGGSSTQRLTACAYISSFVARGARISKHSVRHVFEILCQYLEDMRQRYAPACRGPDKRNYTLYYAVAQAVLYVFCFRWRDLVVGSTPEQDGEELNVDDAIAEDRELVFLPGIKEVLHNNIYSRLNPLKVCSPAIVSEFAKIASYLRFLFVFPLLETNKRIRLGSTFSYYGNGTGVDIGRRETAWDRKTGEAHHHLEAYFPFDPYHLPKSKRWVKDDYNAWKLPPGMKKDDENDENDESESEDDYGSDEESLPEEAGYFTIPASLSPT